MRQAKALGIPLLCAALIASCDQSPPAPSPVPDPAAASPASLKAADAACRLPLRQFGRSRMRLVEDRFGYPLNLVIVDRSGALLWNGVRVERRRLEDYVAAQAEAAPPPFLVVTPERDAPCARVQETLAIALRAGRCRPDMCAFEWPGTDAPPPPPAETATGKREAKSL